MVSRVSIAFAAAVAVSALFSGSAASADAMRGSLALSADNPMSLGGEAGDIIFSAVEAARTERLDLAAAESVDHADPAVRLMDRTPDEIKNYFDLYLYVSKAKAGPIAQHMFVYQRGFDGEMTLLHDWPVSTGREKKERTPSGRRTFTNTPEGIYKLDPNRFHAKYRSKAWNADMPWTMFLDLVEKGNITGYAIHAAGKSKISQLGRRASGGCIRLAPDNARTLFKMVQKSYAGLVPVFAMSGNSTGIVGRPSRLADGSMELTYGYRVLLHIEDYAGEHLPAMAVASFVPAAVGAR